ncbi:hypothetical protein ECDEC11C_5918 [Escherichia coli DEC11C]|nr:hypothetical protein ECDEC11C_5918 [Escherichia coli DEC11C]
MPILNNRESRSDRAGNIKKAFEGELNFVLKLAREMGRADGAPCLPG